MKINISSISEFNIIEGRGFKPLLNPYFDISIDLRIEIQYALFGKPHPNNDQKFFSYVWSNFPNFCEETYQPLNYSAAHISHIITKGSRQDMRYDVRNINILSSYYHTYWENEIIEKKKKLKVYWKNIPKIELLNHEYNLCTV